MKYLIAILLFFGLFILAPDVDAASRLHKFRDFTASYYRQEAATRTKVRSRPNRKTWAIILGIASLLLGGIGLARFYMGYGLEGTLQLAGWILGVVGIFLFILGALSVTGGAITVPTSFLVASLSCLGIWAVSFLWQLVDLVRICAGNLRPRRRGRLRAN